MARRNSGAPHVDHGGLGRRVGHTDGQPSGDRRARAFLVMGVSVAAEFCFVLLLLRVLFRGPWLAAVGRFFLFFVGSQGDRSHLVFDAISISVAILVLLRYGLFATVVFGSVMAFTDTTLLTTDFTAWYGQGSLVGVIVVSALAVWAFLVSLGGRPLFATGSLDHSY
jgi:hypothetical protein